LTTALRSALQKRSNDAATLLTVKELFTALFYWYELYFYLMRITFLLFLFALIVSCKNNKDQNQAQPVPPAKTDTLPYYDISKEIRNEILQVNDIKKPFIYKITEQKGKKDSVVIDKDQFNKLAAAFYEVQLNKPEIKSQYKESVFADNETKSYVLDYKATNSSLPFKSISVMLDNERQDFKRADLFRSYQRNDTLYEERLAWIVGKKFQVIQIATAGNNELTKQTYVYWRERK
jgi:hypothetical protein